MSADTIEFRCSNCGKLLKVPARLAGKKGKCPGCLAPVEAPGQSLAPAAPLKDEAEQRSWTILANVPLAELTRRFPDYDVAYLRAATPSNKLEDYKGTDPEILRQGLKRSRRKSPILGKLAGYYGIWKQDLERALDYCVQCLRARTTRLGASDHDPGTAFLLLSFCAGKLGLEEEQRWAQAHFDGAPLTGSDTARLAAALANADGGKTKAQLQAGVASIVAEGVFGWPVEGAEPRDDGPGPEDVREKPCVLCGATTQYLPGGNIGCIGIHARGVTNRYVICTTCSYAHSFAEKEKRIAARSKAVRDRSSDDV